VSARSIGELRRLTQRLEKEVAALESEVASLAKSPADAAKLAAAREALGARSAELDGARDELEGLEGAVEDERQAVDELEQLVDSFGATIARVPELAAVLQAMKLTVGALATTKRLQRANEALREPQQIAASLSEALGLLAAWISTPAGKVRIPDELTGTLRADRREHFEDVPVQHRGRAGVASLDVRFE